MSRPAPALLALCLGVAAALALASCGSGPGAKLLPGKTAREITENLATVRQLAAESECISAQDEAQQVSNQVADIEGIDPKLKEALEAGAAKLNEVVDTCNEEPPEEEETEESAATTEATSKSEKERKPTKRKAEPPGHAEPEAREPEETTPSGPPYGEAKGHEAPGEGGGGEAPSGGIGPGSEAGGGD